LKHDDRNKKEIPNTQMKASSKEKINRKGRRKKESYTKTEISSEN